MTTVDRVYCHLGHDILVNIHMKMILTLVALQDAVAIALNVAVFHALFQTKRLHIHLRILLMHINVVLILRTTCTGIRAGYILILPMITSDDCDFIFDYKFCTLFSTISQSNLDNLVVCFFVAAIERLTATVLSKSYELYSYPAVVTIFGVTLPWIIPIINISKAILARKKDEPIVFCSSSENQNFEQLMLLDLPLCVCAIIIASISMYLSTYKKRRYQNNLSTRFQLGENIRVSKHIVRLSILFSLIMIIHIGALVFLKNIKNLDNMKAFSLAKEWSSFFIPVFANAFPIWLILMDSKISQKVFCGRPLFHKVNVAPLASASEYFKSYKLQWS